MHAPPRVLHYTNVHACSILLKDIRDRPARHGRFDHLCTCTHMHILADHVIFVNKLAREFSCLAALLARAPKGRRLE